MEANVDDIATFTILSRLAYNVLKTKKLPFKFANYKSVHDAPNDDNNICILSEEELAAIW